MLSYESAAFSAIIICSSSVGTQCSSRECKKLWSIQITNTKSTALLLPFCDLITVDRQGNVIFLGGLWDLCPGKPEPQDGPINPPFFQISKEKPAPPSASHASFSNSQCWSNLVSVESFWRHLAKQLPLATMETRSHGTDNTWYALSATFNGIWRWL